MTNPRIVSNVTTKKNGNVEFSGSIPVPKEIQGNLREAEAMFREYLWPKVRHGYKRDSRKLTWSKGKLLLSFKIVDVPYRGRSFSNPN